MSDLKGKVGEVHMTIEVTRAETGEVEVFNLVGSVEENEEISKENEEEGNS